MGCRLDVEEGDEFCADQPFVIIGQIGDAFGGVTRASFARYGDVPSKRAVPKNGQQLGVAVPKIEHPGAQTRVGIGLRERQICRRILRNDAVWP
jgi:hypothetical protein